MSVDCRQAEDIPDFIPVHSQRSTLSCAVSSCLCFVCDMDGACFNLIQSLAVENAVRDAGREPAEAERQRARAEGHEEGDGGDEGLSAEFCRCWAVPNFMQ